MLLHVGQVVILLKDSHPALKLVAGDVGVVHRFGPGVDDKPSIFILFKGSEVHIDQDRFDEYFSIKEMSNIKVL